MTTYSNSIYNNSLIEFRVSLLIDIYLIRLIEIGQSDIFCHFPQNYPFFLRANYGNGQRKYY